MTLTPSYDILKKDAAALVWVQAMDDLELAKLRIRERACVRVGLEQPVIEARQVAEHEV